VQILITSKKTPQSRPAIGGRLPFSLLWAAIPALSACFHELGCAGLNSAKSYISSLKLQLFNTLLPPRSVSVFFFVQRGQEGWSGSDQSAQVVQHSLDVWHPWSQLVQLVHKHHGSQALVLGNDDLRWIAVKQSTVNK
jgi:hypothetical protein